MRTVSLEGVLEGLGIQAHGRPDSHGIDVSVPFLTQELRIFLGRLDATRRQIQRREAGAPVADLPGEPDEIRASLATTLQEQTGHAKQQGYDAKTADFQQAQWVAATVADATLASFDWWGRGATAPLAADFPLPDGAPGEVVAQIEDLLAAIPPQPGLAEVYLLALTAGLPVGDTSPDEIEELRRQLFAQVGNQRPELAQPPPSQLFPGAYTRSQQRGPALYLPRVRGWLVALGAVLAGLGVASYLVYHWATDSAAESLRQLLKLLG